MAVKSAVVENLNHISHFHTFLSQFSQFFLQKPVLCFIVLAGLCHIQTFLVPRWKEEKEFLILES